MVPSCNLQISLSKPIIPGQPTKPVSAGPVAGETRTFWKYAQSHLHSFEVQYLPPQQMRIYEDYKRLNKCNFRIWLAPAVIRYINLQVRKIGFLHTVRHLHLLTASDSPNLPIWKWDLHFECLLWTMEGSSLCWPDYFKLDVRGKEHVKEREKAFEDMHDRRSAAGVKNTAEEMESHLDQTSEPVLSTVSLTDPCQTLRPPGECTGAILKISRKLISATFQQLLTFYVDPSLTDILYARWCIAHVLPSSY